jgi:hypothetical protein
VIEHSIPSTNNILLLDLEKLIVIANTETQLYCESIGLEFNIRSKDIKSLYYNFLILQVCKYLEYNTTNKHMVLFMNTDNVIPRYIKTLINKLDKILPVSVLYYNTTIDNFKKLLSERDVDAVVVVDSLKKHDNLDVSIRKFKKFLKHNKLQYIYNNYLNSAQIKFSLYT